jgi:phosphate transport system substrate-binding protein
MTTMRAFMRRVGVAVVGLLLFSGSLAAQEQIQVGGTSGMVPMMQDLAKAYQSKHPGERVEVLEGSLDSSGGIKAVEAGRIAIGLTGRTLRPDEKGKAVHRSIGRMPMVVAVHKDLPITTLTQSQICEIYGGKIRSWQDVGGPQAKILVLTRSDIDSSTKESFRKGLACFKDLKETPEAVVLNEATDMNRTLGGRPFTIGLTDLGAVVESQGRFKAVAIDGVPPAGESVRSGKYKLFREFGVVTRGEPQGLTLRFLDFVAGPDGAHIMGQHGVVGVR